MSSPNTPGAAASSPAPPPGPPRPGQQIKDLTTREQPPAVALDEVADVVILKATFLHDAGRCITAHGVINVALQDWQTRYPAEPRAGLRLLTALLGQLAVCNQRTEILPLVRQHTGLLPALGEPGRGSAVEALITATGDARARRQHHRHCQIGATPIRPRWPAIRRSIGQLDYLRDMLPDGIGECSGRTVSSFAVEELTTTVRASLRAAAPQEPSAVVCLLAAALLAGMRFVPMPASADARSAYARRAATNQATPGRVCVINPGTTHHLPPPTDDGGPLGSNPLPSNPSPKGSR